MADETPRNASLAEVRTAVAHFRARFPPDEELDQRMRLLHALLARVVEHARFGVPAVLTNREGLDAFAYEAWAAYADKHPQGQMNQPRREPIRKLASYWGRELEAGKSGADRTPLVRDEHFEFVRQDTGFAITERIKDPFQLVPVRLYVRWTAPAARATRSTKGDGAEEEGVWLAIGVERADLPPSPPVEDPRIVLPPSSPEQLLREQARLLVVAFHAAQRPSFQYEERGVRVDVASRRRGGKRIGWSLLTAVALVLAGCGVAYRHEVAAGTQVYYQIVRLLGANAYCDGPRHDRPAIVVNWGPAAPSGWFTHTYLVRNGKRLARVDGLEEYRDRAVEPGRTYTYGFELRDVFGRLLVRDNTVSSDVARRCPDRGDSVVSPITVSPTVGTFGTPFTFTIRTPPVDGQPVRYAWAWKATRLDAARHLVAPPPRITHEPSTVIVFDPCTCGQAGTTPEGARRWTCWIGTTVTFSNGDVVRYGSPMVTIIDPENRQCSSEQLARSDAVP